MTTKFSCVLPLLFSCFLMSGQSPANIIQVQEGSLKYVDFRRIAMTIVGEEWQPVSANNKVTYIFIAEDLTTRELKTWDSEEGMKEIYLPRGNWRITREIIICTHQCEVVERVKSNPLAFVWRN